MIANYYQRKFTIIQSNFGGFLHYKDIIKQKPINIILNQIMICWIIVIVRWKRLATIRSYLSIIASLTQILGQFLGHGWISERRVFWYTILLKYHYSNGQFIGVSGVKRGCDRTYSTVIYSTVILTKYINLELIKYLLIDIVLKLKIYF